MPRAQGIYVDEDEEKAAVVVDVVDFDDETSGSPSVASHRNPKEKASISPYARRQNEKHELKGSFIDLGCHWLMMLLLAFAIGGLRIEKKAKVFHC